MYPLRFRPLFRRYIWGGRRLATVLNKPIGEDLCAESWEIVDHGDDQSVVKYGQFAGSSLRELVADHGQALLGTSVLQQITCVDTPTNLQGRFPLLLKFLDANRSLSVQVHPDDHLGAKLDPPDLGKTEAWYVMHADPGAKIYAGLKPGVTSDDLRSAISNGTTEHLLHSFEPMPGDCVFIRAGTLHAIGQGLLIAEIQQASDTTYRIFDWNRVDRDGNPRPLHIEESLTATNFELGPVDPIAPQQTDSSNADIIVSCEKFVMRKWELNEPTQFHDDKMHILAVTQGEIELSGDPSGQALTLGDTALVPACCSTTITPTEPTSLLEIHLPY